jgi:hypothetical protein
VSGLPRFLPDDAPIAPDLVVLLDRDHALDAARRSGAARDAALAELMTAHVVLDVVVPRRRDGRLLTLAERLEWLVAAADTREVRAGLAACGQGEDNRR